ncbi:MAG: azurin [Xanthomarina gelatinilytica]|uniref:azurin n=1 Tax=Xanthomarina gelatinilytica TaxID=1137281 RepID=UPI003A8B1D49
MKKTIILLAAALIMFSCGNDNKTKQQTESSTKETVKKEPIKETSSNEITLLLSSNDQMQYDKKELKVKVGQKVTLTLKHTGTMAKDVMGHNFVLLKKDVDVPTFAEKAVAATATEYIPEGDDIIIYTKLIGGGESVTITFDAPAKGSYDYICSFPGHYALMKGKFIVE